MLWLWRAWQRRRLLARPFPAAWEEIIRDRLPYAATLTGDDAARWRNHLKLLVWGKRFEGAQGLEVTDEMRVVVAGQAARIARRLPWDAYDRLSTILLYPSHYRHQGRDGAVLGEAHPHGLVVLSWDAVTHGVRDPKDGRCTAMHEFAHVLDVSDGAFDGTPELHESGDYRRWAVVLSEHFFALRRAPHRSVLRAYGATNEAEFFAVATEAFFERPARLRARAPELYAVLAGYFRVEPVDGEALERTRRTAG